MLGLYFFCESNNFLALAISLEGAKSFKPDMVINRKPENRNGLASFRKREIKKLTGKGSG